MCYFFNALGCLNFINLGLFIFPDHENWFGSDDVLGPLAISVKRERVDLSNNGSSNDITSSANHKEVCVTPSRYMYRLIVRSTEVRQYGKLSHYKALYFVRYFLTLLLADVCECFYD